MRVHIDEHALEIHLAWWEKLFGLMRNIRVPRADVDAVDAVAEPLSLAMHAGMKAGLRIPWVLFVARTLRLDEAFIVRRNVPGVAIHVRNHGALQRIVLSTRDADSLVREYEASAGGADPANATQSPPARAD